MLEFPVYRTYVAGGAPSEADRAIIERTIAAARAHWHGPDPEIFDFLRDVITLDLFEDHGPTVAPRIAQLRA